MKKVKILKVEEFNALNENFLHNIRMQDVSGEPLLTTNTEPLFESEKAPSLQKIENAIIALPYTIEGNVTIDALTNTITQFLKNQQVKGECGYSVGHYFAGDYKSGNCVWNEKSLCVSLVGEISDRSGTIAVAIEIMRVHNLSRILIINEMSVMEITRDGSQIKPLPQNRIRRIGD